MNQKRIISLSATGTEIVIELGLEEHLVGYSFEMELIKNLKPTVIILEKEHQTVEVNFNAIKEALDGSVEIIVLGQNNLDAVFTGIKTVSEVLGVPKHGEDLVGRMQERMDLIKHKLKFITQKPKLACIDRLEPLVIAGNWMPELVEIAGGQAILAQSGKQSPIIDWIDLVEADPGIIIVMPRGFSIERTLKEMDILLQQPYFQDLQAVKNNQLFIADANQYFNTSGPRIADSVEILAEIINPKQFIFGYEGEGWIKFRA